MNGGIFSGTRELAQAGSVTSGEQFVRAQPVELLS